MDGKFRGLAEERSADPETQSRIDREQGYLGLAEWLGKVEKIWRDKRGEKAQQVRLYEWLDDRKKLTQQYRKRYTVVYPDVNRVIGRGGTH